MPAQTISILAIIRLPENDHRFDHHRHPSGCCGTDLVLHRLLHVLLQVLLGTAFTNLGHNRIRLSTGRLRGVRRESPDRRHQQRHVYRSGPKLGLVIYFDHSRHNRVFCGYHFGRACGHVWIVLKWRVMYGYGLSERSVVDVCKVWE